jgi:hypothetical protein
MDTRERTSDARELLQMNPPQGSPAGGQLQELRQAGEELLAAADEAIRRALSGDSEAFIRSSRQQGGQ